MMPNSYLCGGIFLFQTINRSYIRHISDYIRTFTWDKKLETILKSNFGGQGMINTTLKIQKIYTPEKIVVILKFEQCGFTCNVSRMANSIKVFWSSLIWVYT